MKNKSGRHPFKWLIYNNQKVRIDRDIAPLLSNMWELGIKTTNSCQATCAPKCHKWKTIKYKDGSTFGKPIKEKHCQDRIWIVFDGAKDYEKFLNYVAEYVKYDPNTTTMYDCITGTYPTKGPHDFWTMETFIDNLGIELIPVRVKASQASGLKKGSFFTILEDGDCKKNKFNIQPQLWIPRKHLPYVENKIKEALT